MVSCFGSPVALLFFGFLRVSEFTCFGIFNPSCHLVLSDVRFDLRGFCSIFLKRSKTDTFAAGCTIYSGSSGQSICPVLALTRYLSLRGNAPGLLFVLRDGRPLSLLLSISGSDRSSRRRVLWAISQVTVFVLVRLRLSAWGHSRSPYQDPWSLVKRRVLGIYLYSTSPTSRRS